MASKAFLEKAYLAYFGRPVDATGAIAFQNSTDAQVQAAFAASPESVALYGATFSQTQINAIYNMLFGRDAEPAGLAYWTNQVAVGLLTPAGAALGILNGALNADATAVTNKLAASASFTAGLTTTAQILGYSGDAAAASARTFLQTVTATAATATQITDAVATTTALGTTGVAGSTFTLTEGVDTIVGTTGNDTITATNTTAKPVLGGLDSVDGGAGTDTLSVADTVTAANAGFALPVGMVVKNVEALNVTTNGAIGTTATAFDVSGMTGLTSFVGVAAGDGTQKTNVKAADTTDVTLTAAAAAAVIVAGGKAVSVTGGATASTITGSGLTSVTVKSSAGMTIDNTDTVANGSTTAKGVTLTAVTLDSVNSDSAIKGEGLATLTVKGGTATAAGVAITNAKVGHAMTVNVDGTGYTTIGAAQAAGTGAIANTTVSDTALKSVTVNATGAKSALTVSAGTTLTSATITGSAALALNLASGTNTALVTIDGSAATGNLTLTNTAVATSIKTGAGNDTFTSTVVGTTKSTVVSGAGNDIVTLAGGLVAGSSVTLGDGNDTLLGTTVVAASTASAVTVIDGGAGTDSVSSLLINAGNGAQFANFEGLSIGASTALDASLLTASTITALTIDGNASGTLTGVKAAQSLTVNADNGANGTTTLTFSDVTGTADSYSISFNAITTGTAAAPTTISADTIAIAGIEAVAIHSGAAAGVAANSITLTDANAKTLTIDGSQALTVAFATAFGTAGATTGVSSIDGSTATGKLAINVTSVAAAAAGLTVIGGAAVDTLTTAAFATTLTGNAGNDSFVVAGTTVGVGASATPIFTTITDFTKGDTITLVNAAGATSFTTTKVDVSAAINLAAALDLAGSTDTTGTNADVSWFQYGGNTYVVQDNTLNVAKTLATGDVVIKLTGLLDLSTAAVATGAGADVLSWA